MKRYKIKFAIYELVAIYSNHQYNGELVSLTLGAFSAPILYMTVKLTLRLVPLLSLNVGRTCVKNNEHNSPQDFNYGSKSIYRTSI